MAAKKMDSKLTSAEKHELDYYKRKWGVGRKVVREAKEAVGPSKRKIMAWLLLNEKIAPKYLVSFDKAVLEEPNNNNENE